MEPSSSNAVNNALSLILENNESLIPKEPNATVGHENNDILIKVTQSESLHDSNNIGSINSTDNSIVVVNNDKKVQPDDNVETMVNELLIEHDNTVGTSNNDVQVAIKESSAIPENNVSSGKSSENDNIGNNDESEITEIYNEVVEDEGPIVIVDSDDETPEDYFDTIEVSDGELEVEDLTNDQQIPYVSDTSYINDEVINRYLNLIKNRSPETVYVFDTFFFENLFERKYTFVKNWTKNVDIFSKEKIFIPINYSNHWAVIFVDLRENVQTITLYDSFMKYASSTSISIIFALDVIIHYLQIEHEVKKGSVLEGNWKLSVGDDCPCQTNEYDCGVFLCTYTEYLSRDAPLDFTQDHMLKFRKQIFSDINNKRLTILNKDL